MDLSPSLTCEYAIEGKPDGPTLFFIHGWPDDASLWRKQVSALADEYRCVTVTLPNFGDHAVRAGGFDFPELIAMLHATVGAVRHGDEKLVLVTHDWGAYLGYLFEQKYPALVERIVALDIGGHKQPENVRETLFIVGYQWMLILLWWVGGVVPPLGTWLTRRFAGLIGVPRRQRGRLRSRCNYPYFYLWRGMLLPPWRDRVLRRYRPGCPVLFLWGEKKPVMFHSAKWLDIVEASGGSSEGIEGAGHWFQETHPEVVNVAIRRWLSGDAGATAEHRTGPA